MNPLAFLYASSLFMIRSHEVSVEHQLRNNYTKWLLNMQQEIAYNTYGNKEASAQYQKLGKEAQEKVGIPKEQHITVKKLKPEAPNYKYSPACMCNGYIFVKEEFMNNAPVGIRRISLMHESIHKKQFDAMHQCMYILHPKRFSQIEKEADIYGAELGNCWMCTFQFSFKAPSQKDHSPLSEKCKAQGYATKEEYLPLIKNQKKRRTLCQYHKRANMARELDETYLKAFVRKHPFVM